MYVITGATGNTGRTVVEALLTKGEKVRAIGRSAARLQPLTAQGAEAFVADLSDAKALAKAFKGARAVYAMIPPNVSSTDYRAEQERIGDAISKAVKDSGVEFVVSISSVGADKPEGTGPVAGLHSFEKKLSAIQGLNVLHLRPGYFMENTLAQIQPIRMISASAGPLRPDLKVPMIATRDIGAAAADALLRLDFRGQQVRELLGQRDLNYTEVASIIGAAIGKPDLPYVQVSDDQFVSAVQQAGMSQSMADLLLEMAKALNAGYMKALEPRSAKNTTPTTYETFVAEEFVPAYKQAAAA
jgi:uncharacterized protein YbjT (DUF2867 family)